MDPSGIFATSFRKDQALVRTRAQWACLLGFCILLAVLPTFAAPHLLALLTSIMIWVVVVIGLQITTGVAGQINLGQAAFMGVGAYTAGVLATRLGWSIWLVLPSSGIAAAVFGFIFGLSAARIKGFYLALTTIAAQFIFHFAILNLPSSWLGGSAGVTVKPANVFGLSINTDVRLYFMVLVVCAIMVFGAFGMIRSYHGRSFIAVRDDDVAAGMMGINVVRAKSMAFLVGTFYAGIGGGLWAYYVRFVAVDQFTLFNSIWFIAMIIVGGMGSITGAIVGVIIIKMLQEFITVFGPVLTHYLPFVGGDVVFASMNILLGGLIAAFLIFEPRGLMYRWSIMKRSYRLSPFPY